MFSDESRADMLIEQMNQHREHAVLVGGGKKGIFVLGDELVRVRAESAARATRIEVLEAALAARKPWWRKLWEKVAR